MLGRVSERYLSVQGFCAAALPWARSIRDSLNPYTKLYIPPFLSAPLKQLGLLRMKALFAHRIPFGDWWRTFDPSAFLCPSSLQAYRFPQTRRRSLEGRPKKVGDFCVRSEKILIYKEWDKVGVLVLFLESEVEEAFLPGLGATSKDERTDRMIMNRTGENRREERLPFCASRDLPHAVLMCELDLSGEGSESEPFAALFSADDLRDFYYAFITPMSRTRYNGVQGKFRLSEFTGWQAAKDPRSRVGGRPRVLRGCTGRYTRCPRGMGRRWI